MIVPNNNYSITGLNEAEVKASRTKYGINGITQKNENPIFEALKSLAKEPMVIILLILQFL